MRIGGLASGMDIDTLVKDLMKAERMPLDKLTKKKQTLEWQRDEYRNANKLLTELKNMSLDMRLQGTYYSKTASSSSAGVSVTTNASATEGTYKVNVQRLASAAGRVSQNVISSSSTAKIDPNAKLSTQETKFLNGFDLSTEGKIEFSLVTNKEIGKPNESVNFSYDPTQVSLNDILKDINDSPLELRAFYDTTSDRVVIERTKTGDLNQNGFEIGFTGTASPFLTNTLQINETTESGGVNAKFIYNDGLTVEPTTNQYTMNNLTFNFTAITEATVTVSNDTDKAFDKIVQFVNKYNEVIENLNGKLNEERYRSYQPLTDEEKEAMTDKQVEMWEERAKSGLLRNDSLLSSGLNQMRTHFYTPLSGGINDFSQLADLGITTSSNYREAGKLTINETDLRNKLKENPEAVYQLFGANGNTIETKGLARRLQESIDATVNKIEEKAGNSLRTNQQFAIGRNLVNIDNQIDRFEDRLIQVEDRYWRQFSAMEKVVQRSNEQSLFLMNHFGGGM